MKIIKPLNFNPFTFSRASAATYLAASGLIETVGNDVLRIGYEYDADTDSLVFVGSIIEAASINYFLYSNTFNNAAWEKIGSPSPVVTDNDSTGPDGTTSAALVEVAASGTQAIRQNVGSFILTGKGVFSVYLKATVPDTSIRLTMPSGQTSVFRINVGDYAAFEDFASITPLPDGWFRCELYGSSATTGYATIQAHSNDDFLVYGAQFELVYAADAPPATSYIETTSATEERAADIVVSQTPSLISSNIEEDDAPVWDSGDSYVADDLVMVLGEYHRVYRSLTSNTNKFPPDYLSGPTPDWLDTGATNRWRMFDMLVGAEKQSLATVSSGIIDVLMSVESYVTSVVLLNTSGVTATVIMRNSLNEIIYERSIDLLGTAMGIGWWEFFFGYRNGVKTIVLTDLPKIAPATIQVTIDGGGGVSGLGKLIVGEAIEIGCARFGTTVGIIDFSRKERDAFGNNYILERRYIDKVDYDIQIDSDKVDDVKDILTSVRAIPAVYIGSENKFKSTVVYGFYRDFSIVIAGSRKSSCAISVEGI